MESWKKSITQRTAEMLAKGRKGKCTSHWRNSTSSIIFGTHFQSMAYDEHLANRIREAVSWQKGIIEKKMFGGIAFMLRDKMFCGIVKDDLMVRVLEEQYEQALSEPYARPMDFTGKVMRGFVFVNQRGINSQNKLAIWIEKGFDFAMQAELKKTMLSATVRKTTSRKAKPKRTTAKPKQKSR